LAFPFRKLGESSTRQPARADLDPGRLVGQVDLGDPVRIARGDQLAVGEDLGPGDGRSPPANQ